MDRLDIQSLFAIPARGVAEVLRVERAGSDLAELTLAVLAVAMTGGIRVGIGRNRW